MRTEQEDHRVAQRQISGTTNQIDPFGQQVCTSQSDCADQQDRSRSIGPLYTVTFFKVRKDQTVIVPLDCGYILQSSRRSDGYRTVIYGYILWSSRRSDGYRTVILRLHYLKFKNIGRLLDRYIQLHYLKFEKIGRLLDRYIMVPFLEVL